MEERIKINGSWYIKEKPEENKGYTLDVIHSRTMEINGDDWRLEANVLVDENNSFTMPSIDYFDLAVDKINAQDIWDNENFLSGVANLDNEYLDMISDLPEPIKQAAIILACKMKEQKWIN